ncbi:hypothetical protein AAG906_025814 [Vitis piasezkii]
MQEVVRAEVLKLLQVGIIYPISDSPWGSQWCKMIRERKFLHASLQVGGLGEDHFHLSIQNLCILTNVFQLMQDQNIPKMHVKHFSDMVERLWKSLRLISPYMEVHLTNA